MLKIDNSRYLRTLRKRYNLKVSEFQINASNNISFWRLKNKNYQWIIYPSLKTSRLFIFKKSINLIYKWKYENKVLTVVTCWYKHVPYWFYLLNTENNKYLYKTGFYQRLKFTPSSDKRVSRLGRKKDMWRYI